MKCRDRASKGEEGSPLFFSLSLKYPLLRLAAAENTTNVNVIISSSEVLV